MIDRVFVTGAAGFIGSNLVKRLIVDSQVYALVRMPIEHTDDRVTIVEGDILKPESFTSVIKECDVIFHCAAYISFQRKDFQNSYEINVEGTRNVLEACYQAGVKKVVQVSACAVLGYSRNKDEIIDEGLYPQIPKSNVYAYTKLKAEEVVQEYVKKGLDISIANLATVYGPGDRKLNSGSIIKAIYENKAKFAPPGGTSYVTVSDLLEGLILLAEKGKPGERYIFCNENLTFLELFNRIAEVLGRSRIKHTLPGWTYLPALLAAYAKTKFAGNGDKKINLITPQIIKESFNYKFYSNQKAKTKLGWIPRQSLEEAVQQALQFYLENKLLG